jgi:thioredoxin reductase
VAIGHALNSAFVKDFIKSDPHGYIKTNSKMKTNVKGIWTVGCIAALEIERFLS